MKTSTIKLLITQVVMLTATISLAGNANGKVDVDTSKFIIRDTKCLEVNVRPTENNRILSGATIKIYLENELVLLAKNDITSIKKISLNRNKHYTIEISKEGYYNKFVSISTVMPKDSEADEDGAYKYDLQIELIKEKAGVNTYYLDFPIAIISYNEKADIFSYSAKYTTGIVDAIQSKIGVAFASNYEQK